MALKGLDIFKLSPADRAGRSPYDSAAETVAEIRVIKDRIENK